MLKKSFIAPDTPVVAASPSEGIKPRRAWGIPIPYMSKTENKITIETKLTESRDANQLLGKLLRDTQNEKRMLEHRHREQQQKLKETTGQLERERLSKKELEGLVSSLQAQVVSLEARNSSVQSPRRPSTSQSPQRDRSGSVSLSPQRGMQGSNAWSPGGKSPGPERKKLIEPFGSDARIRLQLEMRVAESEAIILQLQRDSKAELQRLQEEHRAEVDRLRIENQAAVQQQQKEKNAALASLKHKVQEIVSQIKQAAEDEVARGMATLERQAQDQLRLLDHLGKRLSMLESHRKDDRYNKDDTPSFDGKDQGSNGRRYAEAVRGAERELKSLREQVQSLDGELALTHLTEAGHRQQAAEASTRSERCREELVKYVEEVHRLLGDNAKMQRERSEAAGQVSTAEEAIKILRSEVASLQLRLVEARLNSTERQMKSPALTATGTLESALSDIKSTLYRATSEAQYLEQQARVLLSSARAEQVAAQRALLLQVRRMQALEAMRLSDMQEIHRLEKLACNTII